MHANTGFEDNYFYSIDTINRVFPAKQDTLVDTFCIMSSTYLVHRRQGQTFLFRSIIPTDLRSQLGRRQFQISLRCGIKSQALNLSQYLNSLTKHLYEQIRQANVTQTIEEIKQKLQAELANYRRANHPSQPLPSSKANEAEISLASDSVTLAKLGQLFIESSQDRGLSDRTIKDYRDSNQLLVEILGDISVNDLTHQHGRDYVKIIKQLPSNRKKKYPDKSIKQILRLKNIDLMSQRTITKHVERVSALFNWAINQGYIQQNVFKGKLTLAKEPIVREKHFTAKELGMILGDNLKAESFGQKKPERYWVCMLAAYSGARLNEICQLDVTDIEKQDDVWVMKLEANDKDKSIKTSASNRIVPLHPKLLELGFLNYVNQTRKSKHRKLFPQLKWMPGCSYGTMISRWFARYLKRLGIKQKGKNFHSFRHTVVNKLTAVQVYEPFIRELIGHSHGSITMDVYGGRKPLDILLNECVIKI